MNKLTIMKLSALTSLILELNALIDTGKYDDITIEEVHNHITAGTILQFLQERGKGNIDLSMHLSTTHEDFQSFYIEQLQSLYDAYAGNERKKWGVQNRGLCLLIAWTNEIIQQGSGWTLNTNVSKR